MQAGATAFTGRRARWDATFINVWVDPEAHDQRISITVIETVSAASAILAA